MPASTQASSNGVAGGPSARARVARELSRPLPAPIRLGPTAPDGIAAALFGLVERGVILRPELAAGIYGRVEIRLVEGYPPVRIVFAESGVEVCDLVDPDRGGRTGGRRQDRSAPDLVITGTLPHVVQLASAPLVGGVPSPASARGRAALAKFWSGDVSIDGSALLARRVLKLLEI